MQLSKIFQRGLFLFTFHSSVQANSFCPTLLLHAMRSENSVRRFGLRESLAQGAWDSANLYSEPLNNHWFSTRIGRWWESVTSREPDLLNRIDIEKNLVRNGHAFRLKNPEQHREQVAQTLDAWRERAAEQGRKDSRLQNKFFQHFSKIDEDRHYSSEPSEAAFFLTYVEVIQSLRAKPGLGFSVQKGIAEAFDPREFPHAEILLMTELYAFHLDLVNEIKMSREYRSYFEERMGLRRSSVVGLGYSVIFFSPIVLALWIGMEINEDREERWKKQKAERKRLKENGKDLEVTGDLLE